MAVKETETEKTPEKVEVVPKTKQVKKSLTYGQTLEARSQRGNMTHQKRFAVKRVKQKEMKGE